jgi:predicted metal-dependent hydrolase
MAKKFTTTLNIDGTPVPAQIFLEKRANFRVSVTKKGMILRLPQQAKDADVQAKIEWCANWLREIFEKKPKLRQSFHAKTYQTGDEITVGNRKYTLDIQFEERATHAASIKNGVVYLKLSEKDTPAHLQKSIKTLLSRTIGSDFLPQLTTRVHAINNVYFKKKIKSVSLKYNSSNWGSCSSKDNLNFSTRLLFAPDEVIDYVIVHELAHLLEMNHSDRFWNIVEKIMPDYPKKEKWLKVNGPSCDF